MLTQTLRTLERSGLVERTVTAQVPVRVDYALTDLGRGLFPLLAAIKRWAEQHVDAVRAAERAYDTRTTTSTSTSAQAQAQAQT